MGFTFSNRVNSGLIVVLEKKSKLGNRKRCKLFIQLIPTTLLPAVFIFKAS